LLSLGKGTKEFNQFIPVVGTLFAVAAVISLPLAVLSRFNRHRFGKVICVMNAGGIHYGGGVIPWKNISRIEYDVYIPSRRRYEPCRATVYTKYDSYVLVHAPLHIISAAKKYSPFIEAGLSQASKVRLTFFAFAIAAGILMGLFVPKK